MPVWSAMAPAASSVNGAGFADLHNHQFADRAFGGRVVWGGACGDPADVLTSCAALHGRHGSRDLTGNFVKAFYTRRVRHIFGHRTGGAPDFEGWPAWDSVTHQSVHESGLRRAVDGGLRLIVMHAVSSARLAGRHGRRDPLFDMNAAAAQLDAAFAMQHRIDSEAGPGRTGWYQIVTSPDKADEVIASGRLAVVLGLEVDHLFGCRDESDLAPDGLRDRLDEVYGRGVRHIFPVHLVDNGFGGTAFSNPTVRDRSGRWWSRQNPLFGVVPGASSVDTCADDRYEYRTGRRNVRGLTGLGRVLIEAMIDRGMIIDVDHMSQRARADTFDICQSRSCPVVAGHTGFVEIGHGFRCSEGQLLADEVERIFQLGGMVAPLLCQCRQLAELDTWPDTPRPIPHIAGNTSASLAQAYLYATSKMPGAPVGLGSDFNGFAGLPGPRMVDNPPGGRSEPETHCGVTYPIPPFVREGAAVDQSVLGGRTFDVNTDGVAHVGMLVDLVADLVQLGLTAEDMAPLLNSAAGYVALWRTVEAAAVRS